MICINCNCDISPAFVNAIATNVCPGCGQSIMDNDTFEFMKELGDAMSKMENNAQGLAGWIISNYTLTKIGQVAPVEFHGVKRKEKITMPEDRRNYFKRHMPKGQEKDYKSLAQQIKSPEDYEEQTDDEEDFSEESRPPFTSVKDAYKFKEGLLDPSIRPPNEREKQEIEEMFANAGLNDDSMLPQNLPMQARRKR